MYMYIHVYDAIAHYTCMYMYVHVHVYMNSNLLQ